MVYELQWYKSESVKIEIVLQSSDKIPCEFLKKNYIYSYFLEINLGSPRLSPMSKKWKKGWTLGVLSLHDLYFFDRLIMKITCYWIIFRLYTHSSNSFFRLKSIRNCAQSMKSPIEPWMYYMPMKPPNQSPKFWL